MQAVGTTLFSTKDDESEWIAASQRGDVAGFAKLVGHYQGRVRGYVAAYVRDRSLADDLCQDAFLRAFQRIGSYRCDAPFGAWLLAIARNRTLDHLRKVSRQQTSGLDRAWATVTAWQMGAAEDAAATLDEQEQQILALHQCLDGLPPNSARLLELHYVDQKKAVQIAHDEQREPGAVRMNLLRVRLAVRKCMESRLAMAQR